MYCTVAESACVADTTQHKSHNSGTWRMTDRSLPASRYVTGAPCSCRGPPTVHHHHHIYSPIIHHHNNITKNHTIGGLPEKPYSSLTGRPSKKINCPQIILSYNNKKIQNTNKKTTLCRCNRPWINEQRQHTIITMTINEHAKTDMYMYIEHHSVAR